MKKIITLFTIVLAFTAMNVKAQHMQTNFDANPNQEKSESNLIFRYYFYPNLQAYYDNKTSDYVYKLNGNWIRNKSIPDSYCGYSIYNNYKVEINNYKGDNPNEKIEEHKKLFPYFRNDRQGKLAQLRAKQLEDAIKVPVIVYNED